MQIVVRVTKTFAEDVGKHGPGFRTVFTDNLELVSIDGHLAQKQPAGTHSGVVTTLRIVKANDPLFPKGSLIFQYEGTYLFNAVTANPLPGLAKGQVIARAVVVLDDKFQPLQPRTSAIVGGTETYRTAHGQVTEPPGNLRQLDISL